MSKFDEGLVNESLARIEKVAEEHQLIKVKIGLTRPNNVSEADWEFDSKDNVWLATI